MDAKKDDDKAPQNKRGAIPFLPKERRWLWQSESQVLNQLGFLEPVSQEQEEQRKTIRNPDDQRRQALRMVAEDLLGDKNKRYHLKPMEKLPRTPAESVGTDQLIGYYLFCKNRVAGDNQHQAPVIEGYFFDPRLVSQGIIRREMVEAKLELMTLFHHHNLEQPWKEARTDNQRGGLLLKAFRLRKGLTQDELAAKLEITRSAVKEWEFGQRPNKDRLPAIKLHLNLNDAEYSMIVEWVNRRLIIAIPTPEELAKEPEEKRAGLLLKTFRMRKGLTQEELANGIGMHWQTINNWESGEHPIGGGILAIFKNTLDLTNEEFGRFIIARYPVIDPNWLEQKTPQEENEAKCRYAGLLLQAYRELAALSTQAQLAEKSGKREIRSSIAQWETGSAAMPLPSDVRVQSIFRIFETHLPEKGIPFGEVEKERFCKAIEISKDAIGQQRLAMRNVRTAMGTAHKPSALLQRGLANDEGTESVKDR